MFPGPWGFPFHMGGSQGEGRRRRRRSSDSSRSRDRRRRSARGRSRRSRSPARVGKVSTADGASSAAPECDQLAAARGGLRMAAGPGGAADDDGRPGAEGHRSRALFSSLGTKKGIERPAGSLSLGRRSHGISITAKMPGGRVRRTVMMLKRPPPLRSQLPTSGSPKGSRTCKEPKRRIRRRIRTMKSTFGLYGPPPRRQPMATRAALNQLLNS